MAQKMLQRDGVAGFYRGFVPNALKNLPNKGAPHHMQCFCVRAGSQRKTA